MIIYDIHFSPILFTFVHFFQSFITLSHCSPLLPTLNRFCHNVFTILVYCSLHSSSLFSNFCNFLHPFTTSWNFKPIFSSFVWLLQLSHIFYFSLLFSTILQCSQLLQIVIVLCAIGVFVGYFCIIFLCALFGEYTSYYVSNLISTKVELE